MNSLLLYYLGIVVYAILNLLPYLVLALLLFKDNLRYGAKGTSLLIVSILLIQIIIGFMAAVFFPEFAGVISLIGYVVYIVFYILTVKAPLGSLAFVVFFEANYASFIVTLSKYLEFLVFPEMAMEKYRWSYILATVVTLALTLPPMAVFINKCIRPALSIEGNRKLWRYLWIIPLTFYLVWFYASYIALNLSPTEAAIRPETVVFLLLINLGALIVYYYLSRMLIDNSQRLILEHENHLLETQNLQFSHLEDRMEEARIARHDLRQHHSILQSYCNSDDFESVKVYLNQFGSTHMLQNNLMYCSNKAVNAVAVFYLDQAQLAGAEVNARLELPEIMNIDDSVLTVLFGNLLENAVEALKRQKQGSKRLTMTASADRMLIITLDNTFDGEIRTTENGFLSSKRDGHGLGTASINSIIRKYGGVTKFEYSDGVFKASVMMNLP